MGVRVNEPPRSYNCKSFCDKVDFLTSPRLERQYVFRGGYP